MGCAAKYGRDFPTHSVAFSWDLRTVILDYAMMIPKQITA